MLKLRPDNVVEPEPVKEKTLSPMYLMMKQLKESSAWKEIIKEVDRKMELESGLEGVSRDNLDEKKGFRRGCKYFKTIPDILMDREPGEE